MENEGASLHKKIGDFLLRYESMLGKGEQRRGGGPAPASRRAACSVALETEAASSEAPVRLDFPVKIRCRIKFFQSAKMRQKDT